MLQQYDPRNATILVHINGQLLPREEAKISVFDSSVQGGDAVWEGLRVYHGKVFSLDEHLTRLVRSAHALAFERIPGKAEIRDALFSTLKANGMDHGVHVRLTLSRGEKITSGMDPRLNNQGCTLIILAEWKDPVYPPRGIKLITSSIRRNTPNHLDSKIHHNNLLNNILAKIEANVAGADDAVMLDPDGFVAETNACNLFFIRDKSLFTPSADACLPGITRAKVLQIARESGVHTSEGRFSISQFYTADAVFTTGTMGELSKVNQIDGRKIPDADSNAVYQSLVAAFRERTTREGTPVS